MTRRERIVRMHIDTRNKVKQVVVDRAGWTKHTGEHETLKHTAEQSVTGPCRHGYDRVAEADKQKNDDQGYEDLAVAAVCDECKKSIAEFVVIPVDP